MEREYLEDCLGRGLSLKAIAKERNCAAGTVGYWARKYGLKAIGSEQFDPSPTVGEDELQPLAKRGLSIPEMAAELGVTITAVHRRLRAAGLATKGMERREIVRRARAEGTKSVVLECSKHGMTQFWVGTAATRCRKCNASGVAQRRRKVKATLIAEAGGKCCVCGYDRCQAALEFHHLDPAAKSFGLSQAGLARSIESMREEARKCVLLCANCHAAVEVGDLSLPVELSAPPD